MSGKLEQKWLSLLACFPDREQMTEQQIQDISNIYWAGVSSIFRCLLESQDQSPEALTALVLELNTELMQYVKKMQTQNAKYAAAIDE